MSRFFEGLHVQANRAKSVRYSPPLIAIAFIAALGLKDVSAAEKFTKANSTKIATRNTSTDLTAPVVAPPTIPTVTTTTQPNPVNTIAATDCSLVAVQNAVDSAVEGQTVLIPAGDCDWGTGQLKISAGVALRGSGLDTTIIRRTAAISTSSYLIVYDCWNGKRAQFSDMTLVGANLPNSQDRGLALINGCVDFTVANARFTRFVFAGVEVRGALRQRGVIYNNQFINNYNPTVRNLGYGVVIFGDGSWPELELGTQNAVFLEDNYMAGNRHHVASNNGARYVFRRNTATANDLTKDFSQVDAHGLSSSSRGTRSWEIYSNSFSANIPPGQMAFAAIGMRGGDGIITNNTFTSNITYPVRLLIEYGAVCGTYPIQDQIRQAYVWNIGTNAVTSSCEATVAKDRDYFLSAQPGWTPYTYPHPLRSM